MKKSPAEILAGLRDHVGFLEEAGAGFVVAKARNDAPAGAGSRPGPNAPKPPPPSVPPSSEPVAAAWSSQPTADTRTPAEIESEVRACRLCRLHTLRTNAVPGEGDWSTELMFIGEAPGRDEDLHGRPFVGRAGQLLRKIIAAMKCREDEVYITNVVKCRPPENRVPCRDEVESCWPYLARQIELIQPKVIVTLGKTPTEYFVPGRAAMGDLRGKYGDYKGIPVMPTFHPSYLIRNEGNREIRRMVWEDMQKVMALLGKK
ncbi:MAG: uracil-DNA glycosylase [Candidatus Aminicenantales bacterium]